MRTKLVRVSILCLFIVLLFDSLEPIFAQEEIEFPHQYHGDLNCEIALNSDEEELAVSVVSNYLFQNRIKVERAMILENTRTGKSYVPQIETLKELNDTFPHCFPHYLVLNAVWIYSWFTLSKNFLRSCEY